MKSVFIISNIARHPQHATFVKMFQTHIFSAGHADINQISLSSLSRQLSSETPDVIITLDLAGFSLKTLTGECLFNTLPCKVLNIIWGDKPEYQPYLSKKLSLSMLFYDATGQDCRLPAKYKNMRYYYPTPRAVSFSSQDDDNNTSKKLSDIWKHFKEEALLP